MLRISALLYANEYFKWSEWKQQWKCEIEEKWHEEISRIEIAQAITPKPILQRILASYYLIFLKNSDTGINTLHMFSKVPLQKS